MNDTAPDPDPTVRINLWCGPRNVSTALMYSFRQRADTTVVDEPLYAHYLRVTGRNHPGAADVLAAQDNDGDAVIRDVMRRRYETPAVVFKQMSKHPVGLDIGALNDFANVILTRAPHDMLTSLQIQLPDATLADTGLSEQVALVDRLVDEGATPVVVDSAALLADPPVVLATLCERLGLTYDAAMLTWPAGPKPEDGVWAPHWYDRVHKTTGFEPYVRKNVALATQLEPVLAQALPLYTHLTRWAIA